MRIAISSAGPAMDSALDPRFGRAAFFIVADTETMEFEAVDNSAAQSSGGAGISAAQAVAGRGVQAIVTGSAGPNAMDVLIAAGIEIYRGIPGASVEKNAEAFSEGGLERIETRAPMHSGLGHRGGRP
jgi:predicted Fe-Mo cluster-binding NifX family protein